MGRGSYSRLSVLIGLLAGTVLITSIRASAAPGIVSRSGQSLTSLFDGMKPIHSQSLALAPNKTWNGRLQTRLPGLTPVVIFGGGNCPGWEDCSGSYTAFTASTSGCFTGDGESCAIYDFYYDANAQCTAGEAQTYCGQYCCVSPAPCTNNRVVCP